VKEEKGYGQGREGEYEGKAKRREQGSRRRRRRSGSGQRALWHRIRAGDGAQHRERDGGMRFEIASRDQTTPIFRSSVTTNPKRYKPYHVSKFEVSSFIGSGIFRGVKFRNRSRDRGHAHLGEEFVVPKPIVHWRRSA